MPLDTRTLEAYRRLGVDPEHPNPDGSDYHIMDHVDKRLEIEDLKKVKALARELFLKVNKSQVAATFPSSVNVLGLEPFKTQDEFFQHVRDRLRWSEIATSQIRTFLMEYNQLQPPEVIPPDVWGASFLQGDCWCDKYMMPASFPHRPTCKRKP